MHIFQPSRLETARTIKRWTKKSLAEAVDVSPSLISHYENPARTVSPPDDVAARLAQVLGVDPMFFYEEQLAEHGGVFWRRRSRTPASLRAYYSQMARLMGAATSAMGERATAVPRLPRDPVAAAMAVRAHLGLQPDEPLWSAVATLERFGIAAQDLNDGDDETVDACSARVDGQPIAFLNPAKSDVYRKRMTTLHELFHMLAHDSPASDKAEKHQQEAEANTFASELLLPSDVWADLRPRQGLNNPWAYLKAKGRYGISVKALMYKSKPYMSDSVFRYGMMRYSKMGWNAGEEEPDLIVVDLDGERPTLGDRLLRHFGSPEELGRELRIGRELAYRLLGQEPPKEPRLRLLEGGRR